MRKLVLFVVFVLIASMAITQDLVRVPLTGAVTENRLKSLSPTNFTAIFSVSDLNFVSQNSLNGEFSAMQVQGMVASSEVGKPNLPVISRLIEVPYGAEIQINIKAYTEEVINLNDYGIARIEPVQPSYSKSTPDSEKVWVIDEEYYNTNQFDDNPLIKTEIYGYMRGVRVGRVEIRPWHYNPVDNTLIVYNNLDYEIVFLNADLSTTEEMKNRYYTPQFDGNYSMLMNFIPPAAKDAFSNYAAPLKYVIVANTAFQTTLQPFVQWKMKMGFNVIEYYVATGTTNTSIKTYLQNLYNAGTSSDPAPLYVLIIGDHSGTYSIPAFASQNSGSGDSNHITDLYFATLQGSDYIPDLYYGRISANSTTELQNALNKILPYEQYTIPDGSYLNKCMLIAGVDATYAKSHGDGTILYGINNYYNTTNGFSNIYAYYHTYTSGPYSVMSSTNSGASADINSKIGAGLGFANYTAHCDHDGWADPAVRRSNIANWNNANKYPFMIGNCCLSFQFNQDDAFGEMVLYAQNEGAVGYIGTTNYSYWNEDVNWGIGLTSLAITQANVPNHNYSNTGLGVYDASWHTHGEAYSNWFYSSRQMVHVGNLAVQSSTSGYKQYYWEIYHVSGDPSLIPYMTEPEALNLSFTNPMQGATSLVVTVEPYSYVAISKNGTLLDAKWSGSGNSVTLSFPAMTGDAYTIVGTKQDRSPYINENVVPTAANPPIADFIGNPTTIMQGQSVTFTDQSQYAGSWSWNFGDGQTSTEQNPIHTYNAVGTYTVSLTVTNGAGSDTKVRTDYITVNPNTNPPIANFAADNTTVSIGGTVNFTDLSQNLPTSWSWTFDGGTPTTSTQQNPSVVYNTPGVYNVSLTASNSYGNSTETKTAYITVNLPTYCSAEGTNNSYEYISKFQFGTINNSSGTASYSDFTSISTDVYLGQSYPFTVTIGNPYSSDQVLIWVDWNRDGDFSDPGENVFTSANGQGPFSGNITIPGTATPGPVRLRIRLHDTGNGPNNTPCGSSTYGEVEDYTLNLLSPEVPPVADFTASGPDFCSSIVAFTDLSTNADTWSWNFGDGQTSTEQNPVHTYAASGTYTVSLTVTNSYGSDTETKTNFVTIDIPEAPITSGASSCGESILTLTASGSGTLKWYDAATEGNLITTGTSYTNLFSNTTNLYVASVIENTQTSNAGAANNSIGTGGYFTNSNVHGLIFNASIPFTLKTVKVYAGAAGNRTISLKDASDNLIQSVTVNVPAGESTITLNINVPVGNGLKLLGPGSPNLYRNQTGGTYPYNLDGVLSIVGNTANDLNYYYYFYNWEVEYNTECSSLRTPVTATINPIPTVTLGSDITQCGGTVTLDAGAGFSSYEWNGVAGSQTYVANTTGSYTVVVSNSYGCTNSDQINVTINPVPTVNLGNDVTQCGGTVTLDAGAGFSSYEWNGVLGTQTYVASTSGNYTVVVSNSYGCTNSDQINVTINPVPTVNLGNDVTQCGGTVTLDAGAGFSSYEWNGVLGTQTYVASTSGDYTVVVSNSYGCTNSDQINVTIYPTFTLDATVIDETSIGANDGSITINVTGGTQPYTGLWNTSVITPGTGNTIVYSGLTGGSYSVTVTDLNGCTATTSVFVNTLGASPVANFSFNDSIGCDNLTVQFIDLSNNNPISWFWEFGDGQTSTEQNPVHSYTQAGVYSVSLTATNVIGSNTITFNNLIKIGQTPLITNMSSTQESLSGNDGSATVEFTGGLTPITIQWNNNESTQTISGLIAGIYCVTITDAYGCSASECVQVTQEQLQNVVADFSVSDTVGCVNLTVQFTDLSLNNPTSWLWNFGDGETSFEQNPVHTYVQPGIYTVSLEVSNSTGTDTKIVEDIIYVGSTPLVEVITIPASGSDIADGSASVEITGGTQPYIITWSTGASGESISGLLPGNYSVLVIDAVGCIVTTPFVIQFVSAVNQSELAVKVYPNPANNHITIETSGVVETVSIVNTLGQKVLEIDPQSERFDLNISGLSEGVYFLKLSVNGNEYVSKLIKK
ncbi:MAG TPA: PKD domain-containing protein [Bacteroidales bacterium]|nr:PKD domain-containing protein [Bacteroidales bacterium]HOL96924.1 PKD domain-containing protein [Bacteroidales bacterium]HUM31867.1 PKD domain-containing protein [Bacteroidales bacterium]